MNSISKDIIEKYRNYLEIDDLNGLYTRLGREKAFSLKASFTDFFINELEINPLDYITKVHNSMYAHLSVKSIEIPNLVKEIGIDAFYGCKSLQ